MLIWKQSAALLAAIKEYDANKWKAIGQKVGKPAKVGSMPSRVKSEPDPSSKTTDSAVGLRAVCKRTFWWEILIT